MKREFKVGDKVLLGPGKVSRLRYGSTGTIGEVYIIHDVEERRTPTPYRLSGTNWHSEGWLTLIIPKNVMGGELLG
jgi:hypothetical protein